MKLTTETPRTLRRKAPVALKNKTKKSRKTAATSPIAQASRKAPRSSAAVPHLELFQAESCPFSHAVRNQLSSLGLDFVAHNVSNHPLKHQQLVQAGGKDQFPFLIDHRSGIKLYESDAIIGYLDREYGHATGKWESRLGSLKPVIARLRGRAEVLAWMIRAPVESAREAWQTVASLTRSSADRGLAE